MNYENIVTLSGLLHHLSRKKDNNYFPFSIRHENLWSDGTIRRDFLNARAFSPELQDKLKALDENSPLRVNGELRSSKGSGELYLAVINVEALPEIWTLENSVKLAGFVHVIKAQAEGETGTGKYVRFAVRQEKLDFDGHARRDFIVVRVYDEAMREILAAKNDNDPVKVEGTLRSSRGSGVNYVRCVKIE